MSAEDSVGNKIPEADGISSGIGPCRLPCLEGGGR